VEAARQEEHTDKYKEEERECKVEYEYECRTKCRSGCKDMRNQARHDVRRLFFSHGPRHAPLLTQFPLSSMFPPPARPLPSFVSLLVHGPYPPSAPIHLCLSLVLDHLEYKSRPQTAIIFSSSTSKLTEELKGFRDEWLDMHAGHGRVAQALEGFKILCGALAPV
jgi:hypothetical protein